MSANLFHPMAPPEVPSLSAKQFLPLSPRILNLADLTACPDVLKDMESWANVTTLPATPENLRVHLSSAEAYLASLHVRLDREAFEHAPNLRVIATPSTGLDHIDMEAARERGIAVLSLKDDTEFLDKITATAELTWALLLVTVRRLPPAFAAAREGHWARDAFRGHQLSGKTLGILGYGRLGRMVAEYGNAFRMNVLACDRNEVSPAPGVQTVDFETLLRSADVLSIHIHLTPENRNLIDEKCFATMKPGAILINTSRGGIIDEAALEEALHSGHLGGAGLDVIDGEWNQDLKEHPLIRYANEHDNLLISPHIGGVTYESQHMAYAHTVAKLKAFLLANQDQREANGV